jgi:hypothetical protein
VPDLVVDTAQLRTAAAELRQAATVTELRGCQHGPTKIILVLLVTHS